MRMTDEDAQLVELWQQLQEAIVRGDERRLARLHARASREEGREWAQLAEEAERHAGQLRAQREAEPGAAIGGGGGGGAADYVATEEAAEDVVRRSSPARRIGNLIWLLLLLGYIALQFFSQGGDGGG